MRNLNEHPIVDNKQLEQAMVNILQLAILIKCHLSSVTLTKKHFYSFSTTNFLILFEHWQLLNCCNNDVQHVANLKILSNHYPALIPFIMDRTVLKKLSCNFVYIVHFENNFENLNS
jgi:hypothetical protein